MTDALLHPIDTWKARAIVHLAADASGASLWRGLGWAVLPSVPASGCFFWIYEAARFQRPNVRARSRVRVGKIWTSQSESVREKATGHPRLV